ncbi:reverse transcriptase domain-containing protein [Tanacetum coccineum]
MDGCTKGPQLEEGENLNTGALGTGRTPPGGTSAPAGQAQGGLSPAFVKENIDVLRTMIKELDNRGQEKVTPRKLFNEESGEAGSENSQMSPSAEEVGGYSSDGSSRSRSRGRPRAARKHQKNVSKKKGTSKSHRSVRSEARSRSKSKSVKTKPRSVKASRGKSSSDSGPYRRPKPMPFTSRITRFRYHRRAKLPPNVRVYEGNKDPEDHLSIFSAAAEQEEWPMPVWCKMFRQTLSGSARNWFDSLDPKSVDGFEELSSKFLEEFSQQKRYDKDPTEIHGIKRKPNEGLQAFMDRFKAESAHIKGVPPAFIKGETDADITKAIRSPWWEKSDGKASWSEHQNGFRNKIHRRGEGRNIRTYAPYARREGFTPLMKTPKEILAMDNVNFPQPPPMVGTPEKRNMNKLCDYHQDRGHNMNDCYHVKKQIKEAVTSGRLAYLVKDIRQGGQKGKGSAKGREKIINMVRSQGYQKRPYERVEHWMDNAITFLSVPRYQLMNCPVVVEAMTEGFRVRRIHVDGGSSSEIEEAQNLSRHAWVTDPTPMQTSSEVVNPRLSLAPVETRPRRPGNEPIQLDGTEGRRQPDKERRLPKRALIHTLRKNVDIFAWTLADMTGIPRAIMEHSLDTYPHIEPKVQKKRSLAIDMRKVVTDEVNEWLKAGIIRRVRYLMWVANPVLVKKVDGSWRMCIDFKDLNKACPKDLYLLPEID